MKKNNSLFIIVGFIFLFILIRSLNFQSFLNFSTDQAAFSLKALELWKNKELTLIGPSISFHFIGRDFYQGSVTYYFQLLFLALGRFDPILGSYLFMIFSSLMIIPLYYGGILLIGQHGAILLTLIYTLFPFYIDYTRFFWNPNYQLILTPILMLFLGLYNKTGKDRFLFVSGIFSGFLLLFHYQYLLILSGIFVFFLIFKKIPLFKMSLYVIGLILGFSPIIIFELRNNFYNTQTLILYLKNFRDVFFNQSGNLKFAPYYLLSINLFLLTIVGKIWKHLIKKINPILFLVLLVFDLILYLPVPKQAFGMAKNWNYLLEEKIHRFITGEKLENFNIVNLEYDTNATVQKYLLEKNRINGLSKNYYDNKYLFVINKDIDYMKNPAYEVNTFNPSKLIKKWKINNRYQLYLLERVEEMPI